MSLRRLSFEYYKAKLDTGTSDKMIGVLSTFSRYSLYLSGLGQVPSDLQSFVQSYIKVRYWPLILP